MDNRFSSIIISILLYINFDGCNDITKVEKFDIKKWKLYEKLDGPDRDFDG